MTTESGTKARQPPKAARSVVRQRAFQHVIDERAADVPDLTQDRSAPPDVLFTQLKLPTQSLQDIASTGMGTAINVRIDSGVGGPGFKRVLAETCNGRIRVPRSDL